MSLLDEITECSALYAFSRNTSLVPNFSLKQENILALRSILISNGYNTKPLYTTTISSNNNNNNHHHCHCQNHQSVTRTENYLSSVLVCGKPGKWSKGGIKPGSLCILALELTTRIEPSSINHRKENFIMKTILRRFSYFTSCLTNSFIPLNLLEEHLYKA
ncbi:hypothetical protein H8356DRAFT_1354961 [Neocallimastix lanati (nom. inval.)]|nr:hypothetical protein H8356DRAFT_1354961 [Neocallimastix sp. JGI-2020a]